MRLHSHIWKQFDPKNRHNLYHTFKSTLLLTGSKKLLFLPTSLQLPSHIKQFDHVQYCCQFSSYLQLSLQSVDLRISLSRSCC